MSIYALTDCLERPHAASVSTGSPGMRNASVPVMPACVCVQYDLDGDGVVGVREFYFAAQMDKDVSGQLNIEEKLHGLKDLRENVGNIMFVDVSVHRPTHTVHRCSACGRAADTAPMCVRRMLARRMTVTDPTSTVSSNRTARSSWYACSSCLCEL